MRTKSIEATREENRDVKKHIIELNEKIINDSNMIFFSLDSDCITILHRMILMQIDKMKSMSSRLSATRNSMTDFIEIVTNIMCNLHDFDDECFANSDIRNLINDELLKRV